MINFSDFSISELWKIWGLKLGHKTLISVSKLMNRLANERLLLIS